MSEMSKAFEKHKDKRISELHERIRNYYKPKKKQDVKIFSQRIEKAWKNINEIKPN
jgi:hypothetical protein